MRVSLACPPPVPADEQGRYPVPVPGKWVEM